MNLLVLVAAVAIMFAVFSFDQYKKKKVTAPVQPNDKEVVDIDPKKIPAISPDFDWRKATPIPFRPFAGKKDFKVNMGIKSISKTPEDILLIESTYAENTKVRKDVCSKFPENTMHCNPSPIAEAAVREFYEYVFDFFCSRYPQYFSVQGDMIYNSINDSYVPAKADGIDAKKLIFHLACNMEEDVNILIKDDPSNPDDEYVLRAGVTSFSNGFDPSVGFDQPISVIHKPVPQYRERLKLGMGRFFNRLQPSDAWFRTNWSIQVHKNLFSMTENHRREGEEVEALAMEDIDFDQGAYLRVERQVLTRLPKSRANIMLVRTYLTALKDIKAEGLGDELIRGIDGLPDDLAFYKNRAYWGEAVKQFMRS